MSFPIHLLSSLLAIAGLWVAFDIGYRPYRINRLRDRLFELRAELFELAKAGHVGESGFSNPAYIYVRRMLNSYIRYAHQFTLFRLFVLLWSSKWWLDQSRVRKMNMALEKNLNALDKTSKDRIVSILKEAHLAIVLQMISINAVGFIMLSLVACLIRGMRMQQQVRAIIITAINEHRKLLEPMEQDSMDRLERIERNRLANC